MLQRRRSRCRPTAAALTRSLLNPPATHPPPANLLSHSSVSTPPPLNPPSKQPSIITKAPARYIRIAPIHPPSKGLISALPLKLVLPSSPWGSIVPTDERIPHFEASDISPHENSNLYSFFRPPFVFVVSKYFSEMKFSQTRLPTWESIIVVLIMKLVYLLGISANLRLISNCAHIVHPLNLSTH